LPASEHTRLINKFIGLCKKWPSVLFDLGYDVQLIEQSISLKSAQKITPDVVAVSEKLLHAIITDCKGGNNIDGEQDARYQKLVSDDLKFHVTAHAPDQLRHCVCYVDNHSNHSQLEPHTEIPFITFGDDVVYGSGDFGIAQLNEKLCKSTSLGGMREPTGYYPFSPDDENHIIAPHVLRGLISYLIRRRHKAQPWIQGQGTAYEILKIMHPYCLISTRHKANLVKKIEDMISTFMQSNTEFNEQATKIEKGEYGTPTLQSLAAICTALVTEYESQKKITDEF